MMMNYIIIPEKINFKDTPTYLIFFKEVVVYVYKLKGKFFIEWECQVQDLPGAESTTENT